MEQLLIFHATKKPWRKAHIALHAACGILSSPRALRLMWGQLAWRMEIIPGAGHVDQKIFDRAIGILSGSS
jgi:hypothetical protein